MIFSQDLIVKSYRNYFPTFTEKLELGCPLPDRLLFFQHFTQLRLMGELYIILMWMGNLLN